MSLSFHLSQVSFMVESVFEDSTLLGMHSRVWEFCENCRRYNSKEGSLFEVLISTKYGTERIIHSNWYTPFCNNHLKILELGILPTFKGIYNFKIN